MFAFEITLNGEHAFLAGIEDWDLLHVDLMALRPRDETEKESYEIKVTGLPHQTVEHQLEHVRWGSKELSMHNEIKIKLVNVDAADPPIKRYRSDKEVQENPLTNEEIKEMRYKNYLELKEEFGE